MCALWASLGLVGQCSFSLVYSYSNETLSIVTDSSSGIMAGSQGFYLVLYCILFHVVLEKYSSVHHKRSSFKDQVR